MVASTEAYKQQLREMLREATVHISDVLPSVWTEENVVMDAPRPGPYRYNYTPYCREIVDCFAPTHPMRRLAVKKGAQVGISAGVIIPFLLWMIKNCPGRTAFYVGSPKLEDLSVEKLDLALTNAKLRKYISNQTKRARSQRSGDTNTRKDFAGGYILFGNPNNHKDIRDMSWRYGLFDDFEAIKIKSKESGSTRKTLEQRFAAFEHLCKIAYISTPENEEGSNITEAYDLGDKRKYLCPCPHCKTPIEWVWCGDMAQDDNTGKKITGGIVWDMKDNKLVPGSVRYCCQRCGDTFDEKDKLELLNKGHWEATCEPSEPGFYSYHISSLYAPPGMYGWERYVRNYLEANPQGQSRKEELHQTFMNVVLGLTYAGERAEVTATKIMENQGGYDVGIVPESLSMAQGNGKIVMLTCGADMNGKMKGFGSETNDARLDFKVKAWSELGACYDVLHGSIGTFKPLGGSAKEDREREEQGLPKRMVWTYEHGLEHSVWPELDKILAHRFEVDTGGTMPIAITALDCGAFATNGAYPYIDSTNNFVVGVKGEQEEEFKYVAKNAKVFKPAADRPKNLFMLQVGVIKDRIAEHMNQNYDPAQKSQPVGFMNFPHSGSWQSPWYNEYEYCMKYEHLFEYENYFKHFESEHRKLVHKATKTLFRWEKKNSASQNHFLDCEVYNEAAIDILVSLYEGKGKGRPVNLDRAEFLKMLAKEI